jgi:hypothetical protein
MTLSGMVMTCELMNIIAHIHSRENYGDLQTEKTLKADGNK